MDRSIDLAKIDKNALLKGLDVLVAKVLEGLAIKGLSLENVIARSRGMLEQIHLFDSAKRLMPLADQEIKRAASKGKSFPFCACWWAAALGEARGRMTRRWWSPLGGLYMCISLFPTLLSENQQLYPLALGLSACQSLRDLGFHASVRWINDVLLSGKKVCGILTQTVRVPKTGENYLLFGIGMNVNIASFPPWLRETSTSMMAESGKGWNILELGQLLLARVIANLCILHEWEALCLAEGLDFGKAENPLLASYRELSHLEGRRVLYGRDLEREQGVPFVSRGITEKGSLILESDGEIVTVNTGEIRFLDD